MTLGGPDICVFGRLFMTNCRTGEGSEELDRLFWRVQSVSWREALDEQTVLAESGFPWVLVSSFEQQRRPYTCVGEQGRC